MLSAFIHTYLNNDALAKLNGFLVIGFKPSPDNFSGGVKLRCNGHSHTLFFGQALALINYGVVNDPASKNYPSVG